MSGDARTVYRRDCSWHNCGRGGSAFAWHWPKAEDQALSACGASVLISERGIDAADVPINDRCMKPGCRQRWEELR